MKNFLYENKDLVKLRIGKYISEYGGDHISVTKIEEDLNLSRFKTKQSIKDLIDDYKNVDLAPFSLSSNEKQVIIDQESPFNLILLRSYYLQNSLNFHFLMECFLEKVASFQDFADRYFISTTHAFNIKKILEKEFKHQFIYFDDDFHLIGQESNIRMMLFRILYYQHTFHECVFPDELKEIAHKRYNQFLKLTKKEGNPVEELAFRYAFSIYYLRLKKGHVLSKDPFDPLFRENLTTVAKPITELISEIVNEIVGPSEKNLIFEIHYALATIAGINMVNCEEIFPDLVPEVQKIIQDLDRVQAASLQKFLGKPLTPEKLREISLKLAPIHLRVIHFHSAGHDYVPEIKAYDLYFPIFEELALQMIDGVYNFFESKEFKKIVFIKALFMDYILTLISALELEIIPKIKVMVEFTNNPGLGRIIARRLKAYYNLNIEVSSTLHVDTDVCISDANVTRGKIPTWVWNSFPLRLQWTKFENSLVSLTFKKLKLPRPDYSELQDQLMQEEFGF